MFQGLQDNQLKGAIEAMLFVTDEPVGTIALADMLEVEPGQAERALVELRDQLEGENRGIQLREVAVVARVDARGVDPGDELRVRLVEASPEQRSVRFERVA